MRSLYNIAYFNSKFLISIRPNVMASSLRELETFCFFILCLKAQIGQSLFTNLSQLSLTSGHGFLLSIGIELLV